MVRQRIVTWKSSISSRSLRASENPTLPRGVIFFFTFLFSFVNPLFLGSYLCSFSALSKNGSYDLKPKQALLLLPLLSNSISTQQTLI